MINTMDKKIFSIYKVPLTISLTLSIIILALGVVRDPIDILAVVIGSFLGTFVLDFEYVLYATLVEPKKDFSKTLMAYLNHKDLSNAILHIEYHKDEVTDRSLNSALFQVVLVFLCVLVVTSTTVFLAKALVLSILANSIYKLAELYQKNKYENWFWALKMPPTKQNVTYFIIGLMGVLAYCLYII